MVARKRKIQPKNKLVDLREWCCHIEGMAVTSTALARKDAEIARLRANQSGALARMRSNAEATVANYQKRLTAFKQDYRTKTAAGVGLAGAGAVLGGQLARMDLLPDAKGKSRAPLVNFVSGGVGFAALVSGKARTQGAMAASCVAIGMGLGQLAITSKEELDIIPKDLFSKK